ncbi:enoyl-CoA hydratase/isomerase family protein [Halalkalirubrum salinum]|uniref:enoyl-CoA hydratase/isomerase family protein n=1 Tax=Halalkalirubrum salinum TaxID=2563889 RepID=UPI0010FB67B7|nr:enoyl-CoA hydratase-related protein [Halalkalirubrum salinum]
MTDSISVEMTDRGVTTLTITRPEKLNALNVETLESIADALADVEPDTRALILTGAGDRSFVAGADISYMQDLSTPEAQAYAELGHHVMDALSAFPAPTIAAINGYAFGGGLELTLACDIRIAAENAILGHTEIDLGIIPGWGGTQRLPRLVGDERARRMIFFGDRIDAETAAEYGLVSEVMPAEELTTHVNEMADVLAFKPQVALRAAKEAVSLATETTLDAGLSFEQRAWSGLFGTDDQQEGMAAFLEDRDPAFE